MAAWGGEALLELFSREKWENAFSSSRGKEDPCIKAAPYQGALKVLTLSRKREKNIKGL